MRTEYCTCDFNECSVKANVEHNSIIPKDWSRVDIICDEKNLTFTCKTYLICSEHSKLICKFIESAVIKNAPVDVGTCRLYARDPVGQQ